ncbi:hypothetical protein N2K95_15105 [Arthrobacter zhaoxinii]|uniref:Uncharacterized protein n=1 Tax=Arthrobacter zhaoxinii TaxID=2964616 RepID=A0ABY5YPC4_9MICC|nr:hypothetical protein [Arthrobacter zhaoxinii]UWX96941.1 hypothetical protein N2K95_15105 [Arthrobacter zhaoxinii]
MSYTQYPMPSPPKKAPTLGPVGKTAIAVTAFLLVMAVVAVGVFIARGGLGYQDRDWEDKVDSITDSLLPMVSGEVDDPHGDEFDEFWNDPAMNTPEATALTAAVTAQWESHFRTYQLQAQGYLSKIEDADAKARAQEKMDQLNRAFANDRPARGKVVIFEDLSPFLSASCDPDDSDKDLIKFDSSGNPQPQFTNRNTAAGTWPSDPDFEAQVKPLIMKAYPEMYDAWLSERCSK